ncbi:ThiF family adenylyltransferase [Thermoproteota archaeon]
MDRYKRQIQLKEIGEKGQQRLLNARVLVIGAGGLGSTALLYLAGAGVGFIGIADSDTVSLDNLHRQIIHSSADIGMPKVISARDSLTRLNPDIQIKTFNSYVDKRNAEILLNDYDFILDASDNFKTKFLINDTCVKLGKPFSHAGIRETQGQLFTYIPGSVCYRCIFGGMPDKSMVVSPAQLGILGPVPGIIGILQAVEAVKWITRSEDLLINRMLKADLMAMRFVEITTKKDPNCLCAINQA